MILFPLNSDKSKSFNLAHPLNILSTLWTLSTLIEIFSKEEHRENNSFNEVILIGNLFNSIEVKEEQEKKVPVIPVAFVVLKLDKSNDFIDVQFLKA